MDENLCIQDFADIFTTTLPSVMEVTVYEIRPVL